MGLGAQQTHGLDTLGMVYACCEFLFLVNIAHVEVFINSKNLCLSLKF
jgi:hypothetical protein